MFRPLLIADPTFRSLWTDFLNEWNVEPEPPIYVALGFLAEHILTSLQKQNTERFAAIFDVVEGWSCDGDERVREAAVIGFLESLQNHMGWSRIPENIVEGWLGPESKKAWDALIAFWQGN